MPHDTDLEIGPRPEEWQAARPAPRRPSCSSAARAVRAARPRRSAGTSSADLDARGVRTHTMEIYAAQRSPEADARLLAAADAADLVVLSCPLYVDSLPAPVIRVARADRAHRRAAGAPRPARVAALRRRSSSAAFPKSATTTRAWPSAASSRARPGSRGLAACLSAAVTGWCRASRLSRSAGGPRTSGRPSISPRRRSRAAPVPDEAVTLLARPFVPSLDLPRDGQPRLADRREAPGHRRTGCGTSRIRRRDARHDLLPLALASPRPRARACAPAPAGGSPRRPLPPRPAPAAQGLPGAPSSGRAAPVGRRRRGRLPVRRGRSRRSLARRRLRRRRGRRSSRRSSVCGRASCRCSSRRSTRRSSAATSSSA